MILGAKVPVNPGTELGVSQLRPQMLFILQRLCHGKIADVQNCLHSVCLKIRLPPL